MTVAVLLTALGLGLRHGVDWDHIAAITDITSATDDRRRAFGLSMLYALGHAAVVFALGAIVVVIGAELPDGIDDTMGRVVGVTLIVLGCTVVWQLTTRRDDLRLRSRWMLVLDGTFAGLRRIRRLGSRRVIEVEHAHPHDHEGVWRVSGSFDEGERGAGSPIESSHQLGGEGAGQPVRTVDAESSRAVFRHEHQQAHDHAHVDSRLADPAALGAGPTAVSDTHSHAHRHELVVADRPFSGYGRAGATGIGMLHGVGVESPTQIALFVAASSAAGRAAGFGVLTAWVAGLVIANAAIAGLAGWGKLHAERSRAIFVAVAVLVAVSSLVLGTLLVLGIDVLPDILPT